ncbi:MAG: UDP-2,3-diacylglucosamine diphosphatase LpxI [Nitrospinae bacterium]|nr:UDP-2,3-diacylglucosamine diphosphatase LpxI [Nitrospinota bacterium]
MNNLPIKLGLIAGSGSGPVKVAQNANAAGVLVVSVILSKDNEEPLAALSEKSFSLGVGQTSKIIKALHREEVKDIVLIGKIDKDVIFQKKAFDLRAIKLMAMMNRKDDSSFMRAIFGEFEKEGIRVLNQTLFLKDYMPASGAIGKIKPGKAELKDMEFGFPIARKLADMEIGQTIVVKDRTVVAVESMEGSDNAIKRGCGIAGKGAVIIKVSRPNQDWRFDVPTIGLKTIQTALEGRASVIAIESERILFLEKEEGTKLADSGKLAVFAY